MTGFSLFWEISAHDELWEADTLLRWLAKKSAHQPTLVGSWIKTSVYFLVNASNGKYNCSLKKNSENPDLCMRSQLENQPVGCSKTLSRQNITYCKAGKPDFTHALVGGWCTEQYVHAPPIVELVETITGREGKNERTAPLSSDGPNLPDIKMEILGANLFPGSWGSHLNSHLQPGLGWLQGLQMFLLLHSPFSTTKEAPKAWFIAVMYIHKPNHF